MTDTDNTFPGVFPDAGKWVRNANTVVLTRSFESFKDMAEHILKDESYNSTGFNPVLLPGMRSLIDTAGESDEAPIPKEYMSKKYRDTTLGGNDALNCLYQFNEDTDLVHPHTSIGDETGLTGMGRVYSEMIDDKQKIMYMSFGVPNFMGAFKFYKDAIDGELSNMMADGDIFSVANLGRLFGVTAGIIVTLPFLPIIALWKVVNIIPNLTKLKPSKYYDFRETMPLYYKAVNTMLAHLAINMGLVENGGADSKHTGAPNSDKTYDELAAEQASETGEKSMLGKEGFDIYAILMRKYKYNRIADTNPENLDDLIEQLQQGHANKSFSHYDENEMSWYEKFKQGADSGLRRTLSYVGFRVEKGDAMSESFSNSTGESSLASMLNTKAQASADAKFSFAGGKTGVGVIDGFTGAVKGIFDGTTQAVGIDGLAKAFIGSGKIDIPDIYLDSEFSVSHSFDMSLFAVYKDPVTIMRSLYIPLACILAGALPRAIGPNSYTSPFICQVHCPGLFSIPMGIVDSLTITRGDSENGWTMDNLPTKLNISFTIKDLSKAMYLTLATDSKWRNILGQNSSFQEYLLTLSGAGLEERILWTRNLKRRVAITKQVWRQNKLNPYAWGFKFGNMKLARIYSAFRPTYDLGKDIAHR